MLPSFTVVAHLLPLIFETRPVWQCRCHVWSLMLQKMLKLSYFDFCVLALRDTFWERHFGQIFQGFLYLISKDKKAQTEANYLQGDYAVTSEVDPSDPWTDCSCSGQLKDQATLQAVTVIRQLLLGGLTAPWSNSNDASAPISLFLLCLKSGPSFYSVLCLPGQLESRRKGVSGLSPHIPPKLFKKSLSAPSRSKRQSAQLWQRKKRLVSESLTLKPAITVLYWDSPVQGLTCVMIWYFLPKVEMGREEHSPLQDTTGNIHQATNPALYPRSV